MRTLPEDAEPVYPLGAPIRPAAPEEEWKPLPHDPRVLVNSKGRMKTVEFETQPEPAAVIWAIGRSRQFIVTD